MGYRGKLAEREQARRLRAAGLPMAETIRQAKHVHGCATVGYSCSATHRSIMGLIGALLSDAALPG